jgi:hypothetical protein
MWTCKNCGATPIDDSKEICFECMTPSEIKPLRVIPANSGVSNSIGKGYCISKPMIL